MKKYIVLFILVLVANSGFGQSIRNSILGTYSGTYQDYDLWPAPPVAAGVKISAHPTDTSGMVLHDTINNVIDTIYVFIVSVFPQNTTDTLLTDKYNNLNGDFIPANDSLNYSLFNNGDPIGILRLKCVNHTFPTGINFIVSTAVTIYPNPLVDKLIVEYGFNQINSYSIFNLSGQIIKSERVINSANLEIDLSTLPLGTYYLRLKDSKEEIVKVFVKN